MKSTGRGPTCGWTLFRTDEAGQQRKIVQRLKAAAGRRSHRIILQIVDAVRVAHHALGDEFGCRGTALFEIRAT